MDQLKRIFMMMGSPTEKDWPVSRSQRLGDTILNGEHRVTPHCPTTTRQPLHQSSSGGMFLHH